MAKQLLKERFQELAGIKGLDIPQQRLEEGVFKGVLDGLKAIANSMNFTGNAKQTIDSLEDMSEEEAIKYLETLLTAQASGMRIPSSFPKEKDLAIAENPVRSI